MVAEIDTGGGCGAGSGPDCVPSQDRYRDTFRADPRAVRRALHDAVACFARRLSEEEAGRLELALAEVLNNVVEHGYDGAGSGAVEIDLTHEGKSLLCRIEDEGRPMPDLRLPEGRMHPVAETASDLAEGGWGWAIIRELASDLHYVRADGRNALSFRLTLAET